MKQPALYAPTTTPSAASAASLIVATTPGTLTAAQVVNGAAAARYVQIFDATTLPADGAVPAYEFPIAASATWNLPGPLTFVNGCVVVLSSTAPTKTITAADSTFSATWNSPSLAVNQAVISNVRCTLEYTLVTNGSGADRFYVIVDSATVPTLYATGNLPGGIRSPRIGTGQQWRVFPLDAAKGAPFTNGAVLLSFGTKADGQPDYTQLSAADMSVTAWSAPLQ